jgi:phosphoenolpyruvate carboxykinase (ATP)
LGNVDIYSAIGEGRLKVNRSVSRLINDAVRRREGKLTEQGALLVITGKYTGRSPKDRFIVMDETTKDTVAFGNTNLPVSEEVFARVRGKVLEHIKDRDMFLVKSRAGASDKETLKIDVLCENAAQALFATQIFIQDKEREGKPDFTVVAVPSLLLSGKEDGLNSEAGILISFKERLVLICGTCYLGEIKKSVFSVMNFLMPGDGILPMHCSANTDESGNTALFFGLSGTGKTTLSADSKRILIGDDEHGWADDGVFNFEGGCYAKTINLDKDKEKEIYQAIRFGALLENVVVNKNGEPDYTDASLTENTRCTYPIGYIENASASGTGSIPKTILFLTADAFGVLPPISRLTKEGAMYHFMSGYTSKLAGTERGIVNPETTFSALFGEPFMPRRIEEYARLLGEKIEAHETDVYLINTGWTGGAYGTGNRVPLKYTRLMVEAAIEGRLKNIEYEKDHVFNLDIPTAVDGVPKELLHPRRLWKDAKDYDRTSQMLAERFRENFKRFPDADKSIRMAGPISE